MLGRIGTKILKGIKISDGSKHLRRLLEEEGYVEEIALRLKACDRPATPGTVFIMRRLSGYDQALGPEAGLLLARKA